jgi:myosin tail region-interacting protein MTI1
MERPLSPGEDLDDERSLPTSRLSLSEGVRPQSKEGPPIVGTAPPLPLSRPGQMNLDTTSPTSPTANEKRVSRGPPPIPVSSPTVTSPQTRAPPPPPPGQPPSRRSTSDSHNIAATKHQIDDDSEEEVTEYDGDYDTDIASGAKHKDALKSHGRDSSLDEESTLTDESPSKPSSADAPGRTAPPLPPISAPRDVPSLPPQNASKGSRQSSEMPRAAPPPVPPPKQPVEEDYDPFRYASSHSGLASQATTLQSPSEEVEEDDLYDATPVNTRSVQSLRPAEGGMPGAQPLAAGPPPSLAAPQQPSMDVNRTKSVSRRSMEQSRPSGEQGFIASDIDVGQSSYSYWWAQENIPPPSLQNRQDILYEIESTSSTKRGGKATVSKDVYVLYMDYSQSTITAIFDAGDAHNVAFEQRHERPPPAPRQDQLESASLRFGARIAEAAHARQNNSVGDGSPHALVLDLIKPLTAAGALAPIGTRAYGALVYANLANASTQQSDEIRSGDIVTFRNAKFAGHKGTIHAKYATEAGRPGQDHVGIVLDWDGTKKKIRVWEQGRDEAKGGKKGKVHEESYKVGDLKSGEVRVYRVMGRSWVGWNE